MANVKLPPIKTKSHHSKETAMAKIYISSTSEDLKEFREKTYKILRQMGHDAIAMEDYVSVSRPPLAKCLEDVSNADVYIGIIAWRRGYVPDENNPEAFSITELEYREATKKNIPQLIFILSPAAPWPKSLKDDPNRDAALRTVEDFRREVCTNHIVSFFETPDQLGTLVSIAVRKWEIENGIGVVVPALEDMELPTGIQVKSYVKGDHLRVKYRLALPAAIFVYVFFIFWMGFFVIITLSDIFSFLGYEFPYFHSFGDPSSVVCMIPFLVFGIWLGTRPKEIRFNFLKGKVTISSPVGISWGNPIVGGLTLHLDKKKKGWQSRICYNRLEFARSEFFHEKAAARDHFLPFAIALNYQLGSHSLKEFENNKDLSK